MPNPVEPDFATRPSAAIVPGCALPPRTLLLVEDSRFAAEAVRLICRRAGIRLRRAESLTAARLHLRVYRPDIVLVDLGLPDGSGLDLIAGLATAGPRPQRLIAVSGDATLEGAARAAGADAFLLKPVTLTQHLSLMTGDADLRPASAEDCEARSRNAGADPLALRDDLRLVHDLLSGTGAPERLHYAGQFLASVGHALHDSPLATAAEAATRAGDRRSLMALAQAKSAQVPMI
ncbi:response regulator [Pararhodobacter zhoushanensis]|uniref:response regulator n=1 Tax=Pararhodobacter zhoushanensis TaxID=2479545 RepID=UPI000F8EB984|nr:response regulator [Pararhodobacter zhoushanensis]